jgi:hypothetical protein
LKTFRRSAGDDADVGANECQCFAALQTGDEQSAVAVAVRVCRRRQHPKERLLEIERPLQ